MEEKKYKAVVWIWGILLIILQIFTLISNITMETNILQGETVKNTAIIVSVVMLILLVLYLVLSLKKIKAGPIIGIVCSILYLFGLNIFNIVLAIGFLVSCVSMIKDLNKM